MNKMEFFICFLFTMAMAIILTIFWVVGPSLVCNIIMTIILAPPPLICWGFGIYGRIKGW